MSDRSDLLNALLSPALWRLVNRLFRYDPVRAAYVPRHEGMYTDTEMDRMVKESM